MYKYNLNKVRDEEFLTKLVKKFKGKERKRFKKAQRYYQVENDIYARKMSDLNGNNKIAHAFARYITNMATSYFIGKPVRYIADDDDEYQEALDKILNANYINSINFEASKEASKKGIGFLLLYINEDSKLKIKKCDADDIIPIFSPSLGEYLECAVRLKEDYDIDGKFMEEHAYLYAKEKYIIIPEPTGLLTLLIMKKMMKNISLAMYRSLLSEIMKKCLVIMNRIILSWMHMTRHSPIQEMMSIILRIPILRLSEQAADWRAH